MRGDIIEYYIEHVPLFMNYFENYLLDESWGNNKISK